LANPSTTGPTWANPSPIRASGPTRASRNPSLLGSLGLRGLTLALLGSLELTLAGPTWGGPLGLRGLTLAHAGGTKNINLYNPSLFGPLGLRRLTLALLGSLELMWANPSPGPTWPSSNPSLLGSLGLRGLALTLTLFGPGTKTIRDSCSSQYS